MKIELLYRTRKKGYVYVCDVEKKEERMRRGREVKEKWRSE